MKILILAVFLSLLSTGFAFDDLNQSSEPDSPDEYWLGIAYANGIDVEKNKTKAAMFFKIAGLLGHGPSQRNLGIMHGLGDGVEMDCIQAFAWLLDRSNKQGYSGTLGFGRFSGRYECI